MTNIPGPAVGYTDLLNEATSAAINNPEKKEPFFPLRPSSSGKCTRALAYELQEYRGVKTYQKPPEKPESHRLLSLGGTIENHIIRQFETHLKDVIRLKYKQQVLEFYPLEAKEDVIIEGSLDSVFWSEQWKGVIDFKSKKDRFSAYTSSNWEETTEKLKRLSTVKTLSDTAFWVEDLPAFLEELNDPFFSDNFLQLNGYLNTEFLKKRGIDHGSIIQYNKNDSRIREVRFRPSKELFLQVKAKFQRALDAVDQNNLDLAPKDHVLGSMKCAFCPYAKECWGANTDSLKAWFKSLPPKKWPTRISEVDDSEELEAAFAEFEALEQTTKKTPAVEERILKMLQDKNIARISLTNGHVYDVKYLKSPKPHFELRRTKV